MTNKFVGVDLENDVYQTSAACSSSLLQANSNSLRLAKHVQIRPDQEGPLGFEASFT